MHSRLIREAGQGSKLTRSHLIAWQCVKVPPLDRATLHFRVGTSCWCGYGYASQILASIQRHFAFRATGPRALDEPLTVICRATTASGAAGTCPYESLGEDSCCSGDVGRLRSGLSASGQNTLRAQRERPHTPLGSPTKNTLLATSVPRGALRDLAAPCRTADKKAVFFFPCMPAGLVRQTRDRLLKRQTPFFHIGHTVRRHVRRIYEAVLRCECLLHSV